VLERLRTVRGVWRSLGIYYGWQQRHRAGAMDELHRRFVKRGDLVFDIGAHVGDRIASFRRIGARVVAVEPQPALATAISMFYQRGLFSHFPSGNVFVERKAIGRKVGEVRLMINTDNPTVTTASNAFIHAAQDAPGWQGQHWDKSIRVPMTTLDALIDAHGLPAFIKIDVEGYEEEALMGLTQPVAALSFEFTTIQRDIARACIDRCAMLGLTLFNAAIGETQELGDWRSGEVMRRWIDDLPHHANSGDIYALRP
jgi:FkbM family methyltransferase